jgi:hypothetical protein
MSPLPPGRKAKSETENVSLLIRRVSHQPRPNILRYKGISASEIFEVIILGLLTDRLNEYLNFPQFPYPAEMGKTVCVVDIHGRLSVDESRAMEVQHGKRLVKLLAEFRWAFFELVEFSVTSATRSDRLWVTIARVIAWQSTST